MTREELKAALERLPLREKEVRVEGRPGAWLGVVISPEYEEISELDRQSGAWSLMHEVFGLKGSEAVEFVYTFSPTDLEDMEAQRAEEEQAANDELIAQAAASS
ncbi:hypothetical protein L6R46_25050 [Myxococcota bacterium]|nr:hypothetical protein [Myxococcota bacterium]